MNNPFRPRWALWPGLRRPARRYLAATRNKRRPRRGNPPVDGHQPIAAIVGRGSYARYHRQAHDQVADLGHHVPRGAVEPGVPEGENAAVVAHEPVAVAARGRGRRRGRQRWPGGGGARARGRGRRGRAGDDGDGGEMARHRGRAAVGEVEQFRRRVVGGGVGTGRRRRGFVSPCRRATPWLPWCRAGPMSETARRHSQPEAPRCRCPRRWAPPRSIRRSPPGRCRRPSPSITNPRSESLTLMDQVPGSSRVIPTVTRSPGRTAPSSIDTAGRFRDPTRSTAPSRGPSPARCRPVSNWRPCRRLCPPRCSRRSRARRHRGHGPAAGDPGGPARCRRRRSRTSSWTRRRWGSPCPGPASGPGHGGGAMTRGPVCPPTGAGPAGPGSPGGGSAPKSGTGAPAPGRPATEAVLAPARAGRAAVAVAPAAPMTPRAVRAMRTRGRRSTHFEGHLSEIRALVRPGLRLGSRHRL